jgi:23S rRNA pseudouridine1911/1915/1917 synthase
VHLAHVGHPLLGDRVYGSRRQRARAVDSRTRVMLERLAREIPRHALHASRLSFTHPVTGKPVTFTTALPADMWFALETLYREDRAKEV